MNPMTNIVQDKSKTDTKWDMNAIRQDFPILAREVHGKPLVYLDNAASSQMPRQVIDRLVHYHSFEHANVHRGIHTLSQEATDAFEESRRKIQQFIGADDYSEVIWTAGTTDAINMVAQTYGRQFIGQGDEVVISEMEHHANIVSWQLICEQQGANLKVIRVNDAGELDLDHYRSLLNNRTKMVAVAHISNVLGTVNPVEHIIHEAHDKGIPVLLDGAQGVLHTPVNVRKLDCDFYAFSGHKMLGPTGIGVLYGKKDWLEKLPPYQGGGEMIDRVTFAKTTYNVLPFKMEAGTPSIAAAVTLGSSVDYIRSMGGIERIASHEDKLLDYATKRLSEIEGLRIIGNARRKASIISFVMEGIHPHDVGTLLDQQGIAIRTGHHCAQPLMDRYNIPATSRASFALYNTRVEIDSLIEGIQRVKEIFE